MEFISRKVRVAETFIHYVSCGSGRPVVLVHGLTNNWEGHIPLSRVLSGQYRIIIPDMPGYGDSGRLARYDIPVMARLLAIFIQNIGIKPVSVIGLSMGGFITAEFVRTYPGLARTAVIMGPVLKDNRFRIQGLKIFFEIIKHIPRARSVVKRLVDTRVHAYMSAKYLNMYRFDRRLIDMYGLRGKHKMTEEAYADMGISVADYDLNRTLAVIRKPTLLLYGREDWISDFAYAKKTVMRHNPYLDMAVVPKAGHVVSLEKPSESARLIRKFFRKRLRVIH